MSKPKKFGHIGGALAALMWLRLAKWLRIQRQINTLYAQAVPGQVWTQWLLLGALRLSFSLLCLAFKGSHPQWAQRLKSCGRCPWYYRKLGTCGRPGQTWFNPVTEREEQKGCLCQMWVKVLFPESNCTMYDATNGQDSGWPVGYNGNRKWKSNAHPTA